MSNEICTILVFTTNGAIEFNVLATVNEFQDRLVNALDEGTVILDTAEGSKLVLNTINVVAIEINPPAKADEIDLTPPRHAEITP